MTLGITRPLRRRSEQQTEKKALGPLDLNDMVLVPFRFLSLFARHSTESPLGVNHALFLIPMCFAGEVNGSTVVTDFHLAKKQGWQRPYIKLKSN